MTDPINPLSSPGIGRMPAMPSQAGKVTGGSASFKDILLDSIQQVSTAQQDADKAVETLITGGDVSPAEVLTAVQKADLAFKMMMQVRNKLVAAYTEVQAIRV